MSGKAKREVAESAADVFAIVSVNDLSGRLIKEVDGAAR
jgi:hypothetical protein